MDCPFRRMASFLKQRLSVSSVDIVEQTNAHEPWHYHSDSPISGDYYGSPPYSVCSSPPIGYQNWVVCQLNVPIQTFSFHNTSYVITANYHYIVFTGAYPPSPSNPMYRMVTGSISRTVNFQNLIVEFQPKILKWDPDVPENCDTTFPYTLSSAQKKNCNVTIKIYSTEGNLVYQANLTQLCPGTYTFTWDGTNNQLPPSAPSNIAPAGLYTFDIQVQGACPYDQDSFRSGIIKVTQTSLDVEESNYKFGYYIESTNGTLPSEVKVTVYGPAIDNFKVYWGPNDGSKNLGWNYVYFPQDTIAVGGEPFYVVVSGLDDELNNKKHQRKPFLERNQEKSQPTAAIFTLPGWEIPKAKNEMTSGAFTGFFLNGKPQFISFSPQWYPTHPKDKPKDMEQITTDVSVALALNAIQSVDVFVYGGHGSGHHIEFKDGSIFQDDIPTNNLYLVVIGSCRAVGVSGFPIVWSFVSKSTRGKKCGIGVGGPGPENGWKLLWPDGWEKWSNYFWEFVTKGQKKDGGGGVEYLTMWQAAKRAMVLTNKEFEKEPWNRVFVAHSGGDDYLGHLTSY